jgi:hypothetical protein
MSLASASKWLFGAYAVQKMGGMPATTDVPFLNLTSGYAGLATNWCPASRTIADCLADAAGTQTAADVARFHYDSAHLQKLASLMGLGAQDNAALATEVKSQIGPEIDPAVGDGAFSSPGRLGFYRGWTPNGRSTGCSREWRLTGPPDTPPPCAVA